jgi:uncharacterized membrane protein YedE/YeeE
MCFAAGVVFALGLGLSGMTQPEKITGFLNILGDWDPSLIMVMLGAAGTYLIGSRLILKRTAPLLATQFRLPAENNIDRSLLIGSALFGVGWGMIGFCPGPAITAIASGNGSVLLFLLAMSVGMYAYDLLSLRFNPDSDGPAGLARKN